MEIPAVNNNAVNNNAVATRTARDTRVEPPAPPENGNNTNSVEAPTGNDQNNQIVAQAGADATVVRLTPIEVVERQNAPDIEAIPQQVNVPAPFDNVAGGNTGEENPLQVAPAPPATPPATPPEAPANQPAQGSNNNEGSVLEAQVATDEPTPNQASVAPEPPAPESPAVVTTAPATAAEVTPATQTKPNEAAQAIQQDEAEGQANNNPIAEQEIGGTVNIAI